MRAARSCSRQVLVLAACLAACEGESPEDYGRAFVEIHSDHARTVNKATLKHRLVSSLFSEAPAPTGLTGSALAHEIATRTNIEFLLRGLADDYHERVDISITRGTRDGNHVIYALVVRDPALPRPIEALLVAPADVALAINDDGRIAATSATLRPAAILALHGHDQTPDEFRRLSLGNELAERGFLVVLPEFEVYACGDGEARTAGVLLDHGFTLIGIRAYQSLALMELFRESSIATSQFGILGHSGGSALARLVTPLTDRVAARVLDYESLFNDLCGGQIHCETAPDLFEISADINLPDPAVPTLQVPYGFTTASERASILELFDRELR